MIRLRQKANPLSELYRSGKRFLSSCRVPHAIRLCGICVSDITRMLICHHVVLLLMSAYLSGGISEGQPTFRIDASRHTSRLARGAAPSNPEKAKGRQGDEARQTGSHCGCYHTPLPGRTRHSSLQCRAAWHEHVGLCAADLPWHTTVKNSRRKTPRA